ncbi:MAG TPA: Hpt domain-containing protein [Polyangiaceae bacterium]|nr:Hpt domain-containing protein [Polyangiaceae bacterium]
MSPRDAELARLLLAELERHTHTLGGGGAEDVTRALHSLKGSVGLAGESELASALIRLERRHSRGDESARTDALDLLRRATARVREGLPALESQWPEPPRDLESGTPAPALRAEYIESVTDRLSALDLALGEEDTSAIYRQLHTLKGAASAVGDDAMAWFCHGLEEVLRRATHGEGSLDDALAEIARHRPTLSALLDDPAHALELLRARLPGRTEAPITVHPALSTHTVRIELSSIDALLDGFAVSRAVRDGIGARASADVKSAAELRGLRAELGDALRRIGPPRPWGAPAAALGQVAHVARRVASLADELDRRAQEAHAADAALLDVNDRARQRLSAMRQTPARELFSQIAAAVMTEAKRAGRAVQVVVRGGDETLDRRLMERLLDPCLALARNAVAHGIEPEHTRAAIGKPPTATVTLTARRTTNRLVLGVRDDGAGVDMAALRARAVAAGAISPSLADLADDDTLLSLLFLPGFSTSASADLLAGRGIGLALALSAVERLGGTLRFATLPGRGVEALIDLPVEVGLASVLWVQVRGVRHALLASHVLAVREPPASGTDDRTPHLGDCLEPQAPSSYRFVLELSERADAPSFTVGVDAIDGPDTALVRPVGRLVLGLGPYAGAIVQGDGGVTLVLDSVLLAPRARALTLVADNVRLSEPPRGPA